MKRLIYILLLPLILAACQPKEATPDNAGRFLRVEGPNLIKPNGEKFLIQGINLGNWLNPEGYMFFFGSIQLPADKGLYCH